MTQFIEIIHLLSNPTAILPSSDQQKVWTTLNLINFLIILS